MKSLYITLIFSFLISCATPEVVVVKDPLDEKRSCEELENLVAKTQKFKRDALFEKENTGGNMTRMILFWPAAATTFYNADKAIRAANDRTYHLLKIMKNKDCKNVDLVNSNILRNSTETIVGQLNTLSEMYKSGVLSKEEFIKYRGRDEPDLW